MGLVAALNEMLLQSHVRGYVHLLPALPRALSRRGSIVSLRARGDVEVAIAWEHSRVLSTRLLFQSSHPWLRSAPDEAAARNANATEPIPRQVTLLTPSPIASRPHNNERSLVDCVRVTESNPLTLTDYSQLPSDLYSGGAVFATKLTIGRFPCIVLLCGTEISHDECSNMAMKLKTD